MSDDINTDDLDTEAVMNAAFDAHESQATEPEPEVAETVVTDAPADAAPADAPADALSTDPHTDPQPSANSPALDERFTSWKKEARTAIEALPQATRDMIAARESDFHRGLEMYRTDAGYGKSIQKAISPYSEYIESLKISPDALFATLVDTEKTLRTGSPEQKIRLLQGLAIDYGIDPNALYAAPFSQELYRADQERYLLQSKLDQVEAERNEVATNELRNHVAQFAATHPRYEELREVMADLLDRGVSVSLDDAYDYASYKIPAQVTASAMPKTVDAARAASRSIKDTGSSTLFHDSDMSTEDIARAAFAALGY